MQKVSETVNGVTINSYYEPSDAAGGKRALQFAVDALRVFQARFGAYPYTEFDVVETPVSALGIEYPGIIVIAQSLYKDPREAETLEFVVVHEVAHQWWYALVGNDQVNYPWLDEALAQYSEVIYAEDLRGKTAAQSMVRGYFGAIYDRVKARGRDAAVNQPVAAFSEASYSEIVYGKGPLFFDAIRKTMGDEKFLRFLKTYAERYRYKVAFPEDLLKTAEEACACSLRAEYQQWIMSPAGK
jgi:aminopeptidase N